MTDKIIWSGVTSSFHHKWHPDKPNPSNTEAGFRKVWFLDAQWSTCPIEVESQVKDLWNLFDLGNDKYIIKTSLGELEALGDGTREVNQWDENKQEWCNGPLKTDVIIQWILEQWEENDIDINYDELIIIHWWW